MRASFTVGLWVLLVIAAFGQAASGQPQLRVPPGFEVNVFAEGLVEPRFMTFDPAGVLYVADLAGRRIVALPDRNGDGVADEMRVFADGLNQPHSIVFHDGAFYVGVT